MSKHGGRRRPVLMAVCALTTAAIGLSSFSASAYELKQTPGGQHVQWGAPRVTLVVDPSVEQGIAGGADAVTSAVGTWSGAEGAPVVVTVAGPGGAKPGSDGQNSLILAPDGFAPAGNALAVTVVTLEESTGEILDADIVINGIHSFAVLAAATRPASGMLAVSTDGASSVPGSAHGLFDIEHVVSHEVGHFLGLGDEHDAHGSVMYAFTTPDDAANRAPSSDDMDGLDALYGGASEHGGCGAASVAGSRAPRTDVWAVMTLLGMAVLVSKRRARALAVTFSALVVSLANTTPASSAPVLAAPDASARVVSISAQNVGGIIETTLELTPTACRVQPCPERVAAHAWGGTVGGITQQIGEQPAPRLGDQVDVAFAGRTDAIGRPAVVVLASRP